VAKARRNAVPVIAGPGAPKQGGSGGAGPEAGAVRRTGDRGIEGYEVAWMKGSKPAEEQ
jgi:hypothetical protein